MLAYVHAARLCRSATMPAALRCCWCCVGKSKGPPPAVKKVLSMFGSGREEDKMVGYLSFLKVGAGGGAAEQLWPCGVKPEGLRGFSHSSALLQPGLLVTGLLHPWNLTRLLPQLPARAHSQPRTAPPGPPQVGPKLLKFVPGDKARDLRNWLTAYGYWNQVGGWGPGAWGVPLPSSPPAVLLAGASCVQQAAQQCLHSPWCD